MKYWDGVIAGLPIGGAAWLAASNFFRGNITTAITLVGLCALAVVFAFVFAPRRS